jgi:hypothetical protein
MKALASSLIALLTLPSWVQAQSNWGTSANVFVNLSVSWTDPALAAKDDTGKVLTGEDADTVFENSYSVDTTNSDGDTTKTVQTTEYGSKATVWKWSNKEILLALVGTVDEPGILPQKGRAPFIAGWSIVRVTDSDNAVTYYARHSDGTAVQLDDIGLDLTLNEDSSVLFTAETTRTKDVTSTVYDLTGNGEDRETRSYSHSSTFKGPGTGNALLSVDLPGVLTGSLKTVLITEPGDPDLGTDPTDTYLDVPGATKLDKIVSYDEDAELPTLGLVEGTISAPPATVRDLDAYLVTE